MDERAQALKALKAGATLASLPEKFRKDRELVLVAIDEDKSGPVLNYIDARFHTDQEVVLAAVRKQGGRALERLDVLNRNEDFLLQCIRVDCRDEVLAWCGHMSGNQKIVLAAVEKKWCALARATEELRGNLEIILAAVKQDERAVQFVPESKMKEHKRYIVGALLSNQKEYAVRYWIPS